MATHSAPFSFLGVPIGGAFIVAGYVLLGDHGGVTSALARANAAILSCARRRSQMESQQRLAGRTVGAIWIIVGTVCVIGGFAVFFSRLT